MTSLRFVGDVPIWLGALLIAVVCVVSWRYYNRESFEIPGRLKLILPLLRSLAFALGILILTGPVLHHRKTIGELGKVKIYIDASKSMTSHDRHMATSRKLRIASQLGWLDLGISDFSALDCVDQVAAARARLERQLTKAGSSVVELDYKQIAEALTNDLTAVQKTIPKSLESELVTKLIEPAKLLQAAAKSNQSAQLQELAAQCKILELRIRNDFESSLVGTHSGESIQTALKLFDETPRWRRVEIALAEAKSSILSKLDGRHEIELIKLFGSEHKSISSENSAGNFADTKSLNFDGPKAEVKFSELTDLSTGVAGTQVTSSNPASQTAAEPTANAAIVLISDGQHNSGPSPLALSQVLGRQGSKFFNISIGAINKATDLAIVKLEHPQLIFRKDRVRGIAAIVDTMPAGNPFTVAIRYGKKVVWQKQLTTENVGQRKVEFDFPVDELVDEITDQFSTDTTKHSIRLKLEASISPLTGESEANNNRKEMYINTIVQQYKVLILDGRSRWETRFIRNSLERDDQWEVTTVIPGKGSAAGKSPADRTLQRGSGNNQFPKTRDQLFEFDLVIYGEISPTVFNSQDYKWLREFVEIRGGGMIFVDGLRGKLHQINAKEFSSLIPVEKLPVVVESLPKSLQLTASGSEDNALKLAVEKAANEQFWSVLPPPHTFVAVQAAPDAEVLANIWIDNKAFPAIVTRSYGSGTVLYLAFDETWRWRYKSADTWHQRAWNQLAKFAMPQPYATSDQFVSIDAGNASYSSGEAANIRVRLKGLDGRPKQGAIVDAIIWQGDRAVATINLQSDQEVPGVYRSRTAPLAAGDYTVSIRASGYSQDALKARASFAVLPPETGELTETSVNEELLKQMALESDGAYLREEEFDTLPELLAPLSNGRIIESETLLWQSYWWFVPMILLLTTEWILRKRAGLL